MEITQMQVIVNDHGYSQVFGLSKTNLMYRWDYQTGKWELFLKLKDTIDKS